MPKSADDDDFIPSPEFARSWRERAEMLYEQRAVSLPEEYAELSPAAALQLIRELRVLEIELELQNDELRQTQSALRNAQARYRGIPDGAPIGQLMISEEGLILDANSTLVNWLDTSPESLVDQSIFQRVFVDDQEILYLFHKRLFETSSPQTCELRMSKADGSNLWVLLFGRVATDDKLGAKVRSAQIDVTNRQQTADSRTSLEVQRRESQKMEAIGTLAGGIAHDFNNILAVILSNAELALHLAGSGKAIAQYVQEIQWAGQRARELVKQILSFSRRQPTERKFIRLPEVMAASVRLLRSAMPVRVNLSLVCDDDVPDVLADATQIEQVVINIATNAMQAMKGRTGNINIRLDTISAYASGFAAAPSLQGTHWKNFDKVVRLEISDDGPGMEHDVLRKVFEPFFTTKAVDEGTGLGLAVVHGIVRDHEGEIAVASRPGHGATFTVYLPPARAAPSENIAVPIDSDSVAEQTSGNGSSDPRDILYLDDDKSVMQTICSLLTLRGLNVCGFYDQVAALDAIREHPASYRMVVTDYNMPGLSGLEVASMIRAIAPELPVVVASGFIDEDLRVRAEQVGVRELVSKPFTSELFCNLAEKFSYARDR